MSDVSVPRAVLLRILADTFLVPADGHKALTARVRLLGDLGVPRQGRPGAHARLSYGLLEVLEIATALALLNAHMPPVLAARHVREAWGGFVRLAIASVIGDLPDGMADRYRSYGRGTKGVLQGNVLQTLGSREVRDAAELTPLATLAVVEDQGDLARRTAVTASVVIDASAYVPTLFGVMRSMCRDDEEVRHMLDRLRDSARDTLT